MLLFEHDPQRNNNIIIVSYAVMKRTADDWRNQKRTLTKGPGSSIYDNNNTLGVIRVITDGLI